MENIKTQLGPTTIKWLESNSPNFFADKTKFLDNLSEAIYNYPIQDPNKLHSIISDLILIEQPLLSLKFIEIHKKIWDNNNPDFLQLEGVCSMLCGENTQALKSFKKILQHNPKDLAAISNLAKLYYQENDQKNCWSMCLQGLELNKNHNSLWEIVWLTLQNNSKAPLDDLKNLEKKLNSWSASLLICEITNPDNQEKKLETLSNFYEHGEHSCSFLVEYTGVLGFLKQYTTVLSVLWRYNEKLSEPSGWQLMIHKAQAHLGLNQLKDFETIRSKILMNPKIPKEIKLSLESN